MSTSILRQVSAVARNASRTRGFASSSASRKDFVQDLYVKELRAYKAPPAVKDAHVGAVKNFAAPTAPKAPTLPQDLAAELSAYESAEPSKVEAVQTKAGNAGSTGGADGFLQFLEADVPKAEEAHH
ncbi:hypothetical protein FIBSPDRAFT_917829 [Athelia psychrophila]|uniref:ATP synthase complex subunit H-domain-containing protein n=1 Tax=Athelia psychrophila TaxID=1759441 RepID=A0A166R805_9AGAM|nr:hypothetical protein FIBSPDRAFT_917829 [Fibularhizoctonia sp. CBS 109695]